MTDAQWYPTVDDMNPASPNIYYETMNPVVWKKGHAGFLSSAVVRALTFLESGRTVGPCFESGLIMVL